MRRRRTVEAPVPAAQAVVVPDVAARLASGPRLGEILQRSFGVTDAQLIGALEIQTRTAQRLGGILVSTGVISERQLAEALAVRLGVPVVDLRQVTPAPAATGYVSASAAHELDVLPLVVADGVVDLAVADPLDERVQRLARALPVGTVRLVVAPTTELRAAINSAYRALADVDREVEQFTETTGTLQYVTDPDRIDLTDDDAPVVQLVSKIITQARRDRASDVHVEPLDDAVRVRFRIDGALKDELRLPASLGPALASRLKIMADMNIVERRRPQDGKFQVVVDGREVDVRVSAMPTLWGEKIVLRLLDKGRSLLRISELGMPAPTYAAYSRIARSPFGMVICTGPTGSGKTTTLYATLTEINRPELNVTTIEDPVEYVVPGINQIQINEQAGVTFASGLRSILRQDPDVILVGEIRDAETARIAVRSALTGHFVLSSLHATDAASGLYRLLDMGIEPFLVSSSVLALVGQRLVRRICRSCAERYTPTLADLAFYESLGGTPKQEFWRGAGCNVCAGTGFHERIGVYELLVVTDEIRKLVVANATPDQLRAAALAAGMRTMQQEALALVAADVTTIPEIMRSVYVAEGSLR